MHGILFTYVYVQLFLIPVGLSHFFVFYVVLQFCKNSDAWRHIFLYHSVTFCVLLQMLVTASRALLLKQWDWKQAQCTRSWRAIHTIPIASMTFDPTSTLLATGQLMKGVH